MATAKVRRLKKKETSKTEPVATEKPAPAAAAAKEVSSPSGTEPVASDKQAPGEGVAKEVFPPRGSEPAACEKTTPSTEAAKGVSPASGSPNVPPIDLSSPKAEFSFQTGSPRRARESILRSYMTLVLVPTVIVLAIIPHLKAQDTDGARSLVTSMEFILGATAVLGIPIMAASWFHGFYSKGSYGRFASGSIFALLLVLWLVLVLVASNLQNAIADFGAAFKAEWLFFLICLMPVFSFGRAVSELMDDRRAWRKKMGAGVKEIRLDLGSWFVDFDHRVGKFGKGNSAAWMAYLKFLFIPIIILISADCILNDLDLEAKSLIVASVSSMFGIVLLFGTAMVLLRFLRGFYPCGSLSRAVFGLAGVPVLILFAWKILIGSGIETELEQNHFVMDMSLVMLPALMYVMFFAVFELSELKDRRRAYRRSIGLPVKPYVPEEFYNRLNDFDPFYASFSTGTRRGRLVLYKYALEILVIIILVAVGISVYQSPSSEGLNERVRSYLNPIELDNRMDHMILILLLLAIVNTAWVFIACSYREGSFARLVLAGVVALLASQWAYSFWTTLAKIIQSRLAIDIINYAMFAAFGLIVVKAVWELYKFYLWSRNRYLEWRLVMLRDEVAVSEPPVEPIVLPSIGVSPGNLNGRGA